jgi:protein CpxP
MNRILNHRGLRIAALALSTLTVCAAPMLAQDQAPPPQQDGGGPRGGGRGMGGERQLEMMTKELNLTPDQVTSIKAINDDSRKQMMALRDDTTTPDDQKRDKMMAIRTASQAKIRALLTDDQKPKYDAMQARMRDRMRNGGGPGGPGGGPGGPPPPAQ